jgi:hypothetical protein
MNYDSGGQQDARKHDAAIENRKNRPEDEHRCNGARVQVLIKNVERGTRDREGEEHANQRDTGPLTGR